jgi:hypothetical protein
MWWLFVTNPELDVLTYLDADLYFYKDPNGMLDDFSGHSTLIIPHGFSQQNSENKKYGIFNVGWVSFRRDREGLACLEWWRDACLEWCYDYVDGCRFADQKYLDQFPERFDRVKILCHPGVNLAPWNLDHHTLKLEGGRLLVDGKPLIFFHFHGLRRIDRFVWSTVHPMYKAPLEKNVRNWLYRPYVEAIKRAERKISIADAVPLVRNVLENRASRVTMRQHVGQLRRVLKRGGGGFLAW